MRITEITRTKRGRYSVYLDGEFFCALHPDVFAGAGLRENADVAEEEIRALHWESEGKITRERAMRLLGQRAYTEKGLYGKLRERADERAAAAAVARMKELGYLDDRDYAIRYAEEVTRTKGFSRRRVEQELLRRGVDREIAEEALETLREDPVRAAARVVKRKYLHCLDDEKGLRRTVDALTRLGYRYGDIREAIANLREDEDYYEEQ